MRPNPPFASIAGQYVGRLMVTAGQQLGASISHRRFLTARKIPGCEGCQTVVKLENS